MDAAALIKNLERPETKIDMVLDTDAYGEIDDQFAIAYMLLNPQKLNVKAIYAAPFFFSGGKSSDPKDGMEKSYNEIFKILRLTGHAGLEKHVFKGSSKYLDDEQTPVISPAAEHLANLAMEYSPENPLYVTAIGAITNIASAILLNPKIIDNIVIVWLGGHAFHWHDTKEFNLFQDVAAARIVFGCGAPLVQLPCFGVVSAFTVTEAEMSKWLVGKNELCDYLVLNTLEETDVYAKGQPWSRAIWDVTAIAWLIDGRFFHERLEKSPVPEYDGHYTHNENRHFIKYIYHINRDALVMDLFEKLRGERV